MSSDETVHGEAVAANRLIERCPVGCQSDLVETSIVLPEGPLRRCSLCWQLVSQITAQDFAASMQEFNTPRGTLPTQRTQRRHDVRAARLCKTLSALIRAKSGGARLLDIGCSSGALLGSAKRHGFEVEGVEPAAQAAEHARSTGLTVFHGYLQDACYPAASFDAVTLMEVIEHLPDPQALLKEAWRILKPNGVLVVGTGNGASWTVRLVGAGWGYLHVAQHGGHISFFNPDSLRSLATQCGFSVERIETRRVSLADKQQAGRAVYGVLKVVAELMALPARWCGKGHDMLVFLRKAPA
ncbi:MAG: class I SAM-dependent methyltransferase [Nitrospira sp.]|nr:class I SAM-dependent methyltransferase [Nitrospira sp.]